MKQNMWSKCLSLVLSGVLLLQSLPIEAFAAETSGELASGSSQSIEENSDSFNGELSEAVVSGEVTEFREESIKHFRLQDGRYIAVDYGFPVHFEDAEGEWEEIDNSFVLEDQDDAAFVSNAGDIENSFAAVYHAGETIFTASEGDKTVSFALMPSVQEEAQSGAMSRGNQLNSSVPSPAPIYAVATNPDGSSLRATDGAMSLLSVDNNAAEDGESLYLDVRPANIGSGVLYSDIMDGISLQYDLCGYNVKESIIVDSYLEDYSFTFRLSMTGLTAQLEEDGSVTLSDRDGTAIYTIPVPYMFDAENKVSTDVTYELTQDDDGYTCLVVTADADWIEADSTVLPVSIDPSLIYTSYNNSNYITTGFSREGLPNEASAGSHFYAGYSTGSYNGHQVKHIKGLMYFGDLPSIPANCNVVGASVNFFMLRDGYSYSSLSTSHAQIHQVTEDKPANKTYANWVKGITWNTFPSYSSTVEEYVTLSSEQRNSYVSWDISRAVVSWYENNTQNRTLVLDFAEQMSNSRCATAAFATYTTASVNRPPYFIVAYRNNAGLEDWYTYQNVDAGRAGAIYIGDYTSQVTLNNTVSTNNGNILPYNISLYYNSANRGSQFTDSSTAGIHTVNYAGMQTGLGWKLNIQESIREITVATATDSLTYFVYNDADGTEHYFLKTGATSPFSDEDGLGLSLTVVNSTELKLKDKQDNYKIFHNGYLTELHDSNDNALYFCYNSVAYSSGSSNWKPAANSSTNRLTSIVKKSNGGTPATIFTLAYANNFLASVKDNANRATTFGYTSNRLTEITFSDGQKAQYVYDANGLLSKAYDAESKIGIGITWKKFGSTYDVYKVREYHSTSISATDETVGNQWHDWVNSPYQKIYRFYGLDQVANTADDTTVRYTFDYTGKTVNVVTYQENTNDILGVSSASYTANSNSKTKNRISQGGSMGNAAVNLLYNTSFETLSTENQDNALGWTKTGTAQTAAAARNAVTEVIPNVKPVSGNYLLKTYMNPSQVSQTTCSSYCDVYQDIYLTANTTYTLSAMVNSSGIGSFGKDGGLVIGFYSTYGELRKASQLLDYKTSNDVNGGWTKLQVSYTPASSGTYRVYLIQYNAGGCGAFDHVQVERSCSDAASSYNYLQRGSFDAPTASAALNMVSTYWSYSGNVAPVTAEKISGYSMKVPGNVSAKSRASQVVNMNGTSNATYMLSGWAKATSVPNCAVPSAMSDDNSGNKRFFGIIAKVTYEENAIPAEYHYLIFDDNYTDWQYASCVIAPKRANATVKSITVSLAYDYNANTAYFDNISLTAEPAQTYTYDSEGQLKSVSSTGSSTEEYTYTGADLTKYVSGGNGTFNYEYDSKHNLTKATNDNVSMTASYDNAGNCTQTTLRKSDSTGTFLRSNAAYTSDKNHAASVTDVNNITTSYTYNSAGLVKDTTRQTEVEGTNQDVTTSSAYDTLNDRLNMTYISGRISVNYGYANGVLETITRGAVTSTGSIKQRYAMSHDDWGNVTQIKVQGITGTDGDGEAVWSSGIPLSSYHYAGQNGYLTQMTYGNGAYITYEYNRFEQVESAHHYNSNGTLSYTEEYQYDGNGNVSVCRVIDGASGDAVEYHYEYDSIGRLIRSTQVDGDGMVLRTEHLYDANNRLTRQAYQLGNQSFTENYTYSTADGSMTSMTTASGDKLTYTYDNLKRQSSVAAKISDTTPLYTKSYSYRSIGSDRTSMQVSSLAYSGKATNTFNYTYTADGNIKSETSGSKTRSYQYDVLGQLIKAVDGTKTYTYTYDNAGNILTASNGTTTNTYSYTNPHWADLLTAFNGQSITYDGVGNPLSYYNGTWWTFGWSNGRQLTSAQAAGKNLSFTYDAGGLRTTKTVGSVTHHYTYASGRLLRETYGSNTLDFAYDAEGKPYSLTYNGNTYYYITNLQGDVVSIVNSSGTAVASYTYDPYGKVLTATGTLASINPLRYRGYYYDSETGLYYVSSRYYDPEIGRWINADSVISGSGQSVQGYNLFEYCSNNPVNKSDSTGAWPKWIKNAASTIAKIAKKAVSVVTQAANSVKSSFSPANHVQKTHVTTPTAMLNLGTLFGKVGFSSTVSKQNKEPGLVHSASDIGNDASKYSVGINIADWLGADVGVSSEINAFVSAQVTPWVHGEASFGLDGIGAVIGFDVGDTSYDFEINGGWGLIAIFVAPQIGISSGQTSGAPAY